LYKEFDTSDLVKKAKEIVKMKNIEELFSCENLEKFIELHSSWDNVANAIDSMIKDSV
jgi:hypothetical protein